MKTIKLRTQRLILSCMNEEDILKTIDDCSDEELKTAYNEMLEGARANPKKWKWYAPWKIVRREDGVRVGDIGFRGAPKNNAVELGYGLKPEYEGNGYMTEAVKMLIEWALGSDEDIYFIEAETDTNNLKSQEILTGLGFVPDGEGEEGPRFVMEAESTNYIGIYMCFGVSFGVCFGLNAGNLPVGIGLGIVFGVAIGIALNSQYKKKREQALRVRKATL